MSRASTLVVALLVPLALAACGGDGGSPVSATRAFIDAAQTADRARVLRLLGPATRARLDEAAAKASTLSGRRRMEPAELVAVGWFAPRLRAAVDVRERSRQGNSATVEVSGPHGERQEVSCIRTAQGWQLELP